MNVLRMEQPVHRMLECSTEAVKVTVNDCDDDGASPVQDEAEVETESPFRRMSMVIRPYQDDGDDRSECEEPSWAQAARLAILEEEEEEEDEDSSPSHNAVRFTMNRASDECLVEPIPAAEAPSDEDSEQDAASDTASAHPASAEELMGGLNDRAQRRSSQTEDVFTMFAPRYSIAPVYAGKASPYSFEFTPSTTSPYPIYDAADSDGTQSGKRSAILEQDEQHPSTHAPLDEPPEEPPPEAESETADTSADASVADASVADEPAFKAKKWHQHAVAVRDSLKNAFRALRRKKTKSLADPDEVDDPAHATPNRSSTVRSPSSTRGSTTRVSTTKEPAAPTKAGSVRASLGASTSPVPNAGDAIVVAENGAHQLMLEVHAGRNRVVAGEPLALVEMLLGSHPLADRAAWQQKGALALASDEFVYTFLLTYRVFITPDALMEALFSQALTNGPRVLAIAHAWALHAWLDFRDNDQLKQRLQDLLVLLADQQLEGHRDVQRLANSGPGRAHSPDTDAAREAVDAVSLVCMEPEAIAAQLTVFDGYLFASVHGVDLVQAALTARQSPALLALIQRFDQEYFWVESEICSSANPKLQALYLDKFISVAHECKAIGNYFSLFTVLGALDTGRVRRLREAWRLVGKEQQRTLEKLVALTSPERNMKAYRMMLKQKTGRGRLAFLPLAMKDLQFMADGNPKKVQSLLNFERLRLIAMHASSVLADAAQPFRRVAADPVFQAYLAQRGRRDVKQEAPVDARLVTALARIAELELSLSHSRERCGLLELQLQQRDQYIYALERGLNAAADSSSTADAAYNMLLSIGRASGDGEPSRPSATEV